MYQDRQRMLCGKCSHYADCLSTKSHLVSSSLKPPLLTNFVYGSPMRDRSHKCHLSWAAVMIHPRSSWWHTRVSPLLYCILTTTWWGKVSWERPSFLLSGDLNSGHLSPSSALTSPPKWIPKTECIKMKYIFLCLHLHPHFTGQLSYHCATAKKKTGWFSCIGPAGWLQMTLVSQKWNVASDLSYEDDNNAQKVYFPKLGYISKSSIIIWAILASSTQIFCSAWLPYTARFGKCAHVTSSCIHSASRFSPILFSIINV